MFHHLYFHCFKKNDQNFVMTAAQAHVGALSIIYLFRFHFSKIIFHYFSYYLIHPQLSSLLNLREAKESSSQK